MEGLEDPPRPTGAPAGLDPMKGSPFPTARFLALAAGLAVVHAALAFFLLIAAIAGQFPPAMLGFHLLAFPLIAADVDLASRAHPAEWLLNSLGYGLIIAWAWCFMRWSRRAKGASLGDAGLGAALVAFSAVALLLGELCQPGTSTDAARGEALAIRRAEAAVKTSENIQGTVEYYERVAADMSKTPYIRELHAKNAREEVAKAEQEVRRARSYRDEAAYCARLKARPWTRYPALVLLALGAVLGGIARRHRRRTEIMFADDVA
jgi:hypothetical protein